MHTLWDSYKKGFETYLLLERRLSKNTIENYLRDLTKLEDFYKAEISPITISSSEVEAFVYDLAKNEYAPKTRARILSSIKSFFTYLNIEKLRDDHPATLIESPKIGFYLPDVLTLEEIEQLIAAIDLSHPQGQRNKAIIELLYGCGLRVSELVELKISDLFLEEDFIKVTGKGNKQRFVPIPKVTQKYLMIYISKVRVHGKIQDEFSDVVFLNRRGKKLTRVMIFTIIKNLTQKAGIEKKVSPHTFRHSYATHLLDNGADLRSIQQLLGHESIVTTEIYAHLSNQKLKETILNFHPLKHLGL